MDKNNNFVDFSQKSENCTEFKGNELTNFADKLENWEPHAYFKKEINQWGCFSAIFTGSSRSGKSYLLKHILTMHDNRLIKRYDFIIIFSKTLTNGFYKSFINSDLMFENYEPVIIDFMKEKYKKAQLENKKFKWLVILDDCVDGKSKYLQHVQDLYFHGRHFQASVIFITQKCSLMATGWMANSSVIVSLFAGSRGEKQYLSEKIIADAMDSNFPNSSLREIERYGVFLHSTVCVNYQALIILPYETDKKIFKYKA